MINNMLKYDNLYLGNGPQGIYSTDSSVTQTNNNVLVCGGTNRGKTTSIVEPYLLHANHSSIAIMLTKRRLLDQYAPLLSKRGYDIQIVDLVHPCRSTVAFDPMLHCNNDIALTSLSKALVEDVMSAREPYWHHCTANLFKALAKLAQNLYGKQVSMQKVFDMTMVTQHSSVYNPSRVKDGELNIPLEFEKRKLSDLEMYGNWTQFFMNADTTGACILSETKTALNNIFPKDVRAFMNKTPQIDFPELVKKKTCLFVITSPVNKSLHPFANIMFSIMFRELFEYAENSPSGKLPIPFTIIFDDFATGSRIPEFQHFLSICREKRIATMMLVQSLSQLKAMYGNNNAATIVDNTDNLIFMGGMDIGTAQEVSIRADKPVQDILTMKPGCEYLFRNGQQALFLQRYQTYNDPAYIQIFHKRKNNHRSD